MEGSMTMDNGMDASPSWEELKAERGRMQRGIAELSRALADMEDERDAWQRMSEQYKREAYALAAQLSRHSMDAGHAEQRRAESRVVREALGFGADAEDVSPRDLLDALARLKAQWKAEGAHAVADSIRYEYEGEIHQDRIADHADDVASALRHQAKEPS
jgi:hypothetical protein